MKGVTCVQIRINHLQQLQYLAEILADLSHPQMIILLEGDLGAGKTTFSQFYGRRLGVKRVINSPTFNIMKSYQGRLPLYHFDVYRLADSDEDLGFDDFFYGEGVCLIEWAHLIQDILPQQFLKINMAYISENEREITLTAQGDNYQQLLAKVEQQWLH